MPTFDEGTRTRSAANWLGNTRTSRFCTGKEPWAATQQPELLTWSKTTRSCLHTLSLMGERGRLMIGHRKAYSALPLPSQPTMLRGSGATRAAGRPSRRNGRQGGGLTDPAGWRRGNITLLSLLVQAHLGGHPYAERHQPVVDRDSRETQEETDGGAQLRHHVGEVVAEVLRDHVDVGRDGERDAVVAADWLAAQREDAYLQAIGGWQWLGGCRLGRFDMSSAVSNWAYCRRLMHDWVPTTPRPCCHLVCVLCSRNKQQGAATAIQNNFNYWYSSFNLMVYVWKLVWSGLIWQDPVQKGCANHRSQSGPDE